MLCPEIKYTTDKTLQTMVAATGSIFFKAITVVADIETTGCITKALVVIPQSMVAATPAFFLNTKTVLPVTATKVSGPAAMIFASDPKVSVSKTRGNASKTMVRDALYLIDKIRHAATVDFDHGRGGKHHGF